MTVNEAAEFIGTCLAAGVVLGFIVCAFTWWRA